MLEISAFSLLSTYEEIVLADRDGLNDLTAINPVVEEVAGACRKHFRDARLSLEHLHFHALLSFCSPKRRASKSFWSLTIQPPEKPKPFFNLSIASYGSATNLAWLGEDHRADREPSLGTALAALFAPESRSA